MLTQTSQRLLKSHIKISSQIRHKFKKSDSHLLMLEDVVGLGVVGDIVLADRSYARNYLVPTKKAYYMPMRRGKVILPEGWVKPVPISLEPVEVITPAIVDVPYSESSNISLPTSSSSTSMSDEELMKRLSAVGLLQFSRVLIQAGSDKIFGSVNGADITLLIKNQFGLDIQLVDTRLKTIGRHQVAVNVGEHIIQLNVLISSE